MESQKSRLEKIYNTEYRSQLQKQLKLSNIMEVPKITKIVLNIGMKDAVAEPKSLQQTQDVLSNIACQAAVRTKARKSIAGFKLREGMPIGTMVTLRKKRMYDFLDKLINLALPCVRDFQGVSTKLDGNGNYNLGIKDWLIFPEVDYDTVSKVRGLNVTIHTSTRDDHGARELLKCFGVPFKHDRKA